MFSQAKIFWQAKIWGILHDPVLMALRDKGDRTAAQATNSFWQHLAVVQDWQENDWDPEASDGGLLGQIKLADYIASASSKGAVGRNKNKI